MENPLSLEPLFHLGPVPISAPVVVSWVIMLGLALFSWLATRKLSLLPSKTQTVLELFVTTIDGQIRETMNRDPAPLRPLIGTIFLFVLVAKTLSLFDGIEATFFDAGHILGSASIRLDLTERGRTRKILFSGDLGPDNRPLLNDADTPEDADVVVMETTYGERDHRGLEASISEFLAAIRATTGRGGNVIIPTFALERAQELLWFLREGMASGEIEKSLRVFLDSPMAISATRIFVRHDEALRPELADLIRKGRDPFQLPELHFTRETQDSIALNEIRSGAVIMAGSGMCMGGRVRHHLRHNLARKESAVIFVGYAAEGTLARIIVDGAKHVKLFGEEIPVRAQIHTINGFSAHADQSDLKRWLARTRHPQKIFLVHGEKKSMEVFAKGLDPAKVVMPELHQSFEL